MGSSDEQSRLWGTRAKDYAEVQEGMFRALFLEVIDKTLVREGMTLLDVGCGSGIFCDLAARQGAHVSGIDATAPLISIARERVPDGDFRVGEMEELPYANQTFDLVTGFNSFQFAANPVNALREAGRVIRTGALVVVAVFGKREDVDAAAYLFGVGSLSPPPPAGTPGPFALSEDGALEALVSKAELIIDSVADVDCLWEYPDEKRALRGLLSAGPSIRAIQHVGEEAVAKAILNALAPFKTRSGQYQLRNKARYLIARNS